MNGADMADIDRAIRKALISELRIDAAQVAESDATTPLLGRGVGLDSMDALTLATFLEREFDIEIADEDLTVEIFETIGALAAFVRGRIEEGG